MWLRIDAVFNRVFGDTLNPLSGLGADKDLIELAQRWAREYPDFKLAPMLSDPGPENTRDGRTGPLNEAILADIPDLHGYLAYACGSVDMV